MMNEPSLCQHGLTDRTATPVTTSYSTNCAVKYEFYLFISRKPALSHLLSGCASSPSSLSVYYFPSSRKSSLHSITFHTVKSRSMSLMNPTHAMKRTHIESFTPKSQQSPICSLVTHKLCTFRENINIQTDAQYIQQLWEGRPEVHCKQKAIARHP